jgi:hypothetical protein
MRPWKRARRVQEDLPRIAMPERKAIVEAAESARLLDCAAPAMPAQSDAARKCMVATYFRRRTSAARMMNPDAIHFFADWMSFANSAIFVSELARRI